MEIFWIFFGVHTFNAVCMIEKVTKKKKERQHNLTKIRGESGYTHINEVYNAWMEKIGICK